MIRKEIKYYLEDLKIFGLKQPFTVLMIAYEKFTASEFITALKYMYNLSIRYNVICHFSPNEQEKAYNQIAIKIYSEEYKRASHIKNGAEFRKLFPDDKTFKNIFEYTKMPSRSGAKKIRFLLTDIENSFGKRIKYIDTILEHVCPYNHNQDWVEEFGSGINDVADRLGNMVLLDKDELERAGFTTKKQAYLRTDFRLASKVAEYENWDLASVDSYQSWLAEQAVKPGG